MLRFRKGIDDAKRKTIELAYAPTRKRPAQPFGCGQAGRPAPQRGRCGPLAVRCSIAKAITTHFKPRFGQLYGGMYPVVQRSPDRRTWRTGGLLMSAETCGRRAWHGRETTPQPAPTATGLKA